MSDDNTIQTEFTDLSDTLTSIGTDVQTQAAKLAALTDELTKLQSTTSTDLSGVLAQAKAIQTSLEGTAAAVTTATSGDPAAGSGSTTTSGDPAAGGGSTTTSGDPAAGGGSTTTSGDPAAAPSDGSQTADATA